MKNKLILGSRGSNLALYQAHQVQKMLRDTNPGLDVEIKIIKTEGDINRTSPLTDFGGRGAFVRSIEDALLINDIDIAVHSLKDLPSSLPEGLKLGSTPIRVTPCDALLTRNNLTLHMLPKGSTIATGSDRRAVQMGAMRPDIEFIGVRGNVETRIKKLDADEFDGLVLAAAGLTRLGLANRISQVMDIDDVLPAPCQGAIGIECRENDDDTLATIKKIENTEVRMCVDAERTFIETLDVGCHSPVGAYAHISSDLMIFTGYFWYGKNDSLKMTITHNPNDITAAVKELAMKFREKIKT